jgi:S1-C subfamily serine protease
VRRVRTTNIEGGFLIESDNIAQFRMTAPINEGNSGGPVVTDQGVLVGVASAGLVQSGVENVRFGTKISAAMLLLQQARLARRFSVSVVPESRKAMKAVEIFRKFSSYVVLIEVR